MSVDAGTCVRFWPGDEQLEDGSCGDAGPVRYSCQRLRCSVVQLGADKVEIDVSNLRQHVHRASTGD